MKKIKVYFSHVNKNFYFDKLAQSFKMGIINLNFSLICKKEQINESLKMNKKQEKFSLFLKNFSNFTYSKSQI